MFNKAKAWSNTWSLKYKATRGGVVKSADSREVTGNSSESSGSEEELGDGRLGDEEIVGDIVREIVGEIREEGGELNIDGEEEEGAEDEEMEGSKRRIKIASWNCEGLFEKLGLNGVSEYINALDIAVLGETFTFSSFDFSVKFDDFIALHDPAKKFNIRGRPSGI